MKTEIPAQACGECAEATARREVSRRAVLRGMGVVGATAAASGLLGGFGTRMAFASGPVLPNSDTLVVLTLQGGFDGLSAVVPAADPHYRTWRPGIGIPSGALLKLDATFGLHPALAPLKPLWDSRKLAVVHAVGSPDPSRSHFAASASMAAGAFGSSVHNGWLDRLLESQAGTSGFRAVSMGASTPAALAGAAPSLAMASLDSFSLDVWSGIKPEFQTAMGALAQGTTHPYGGQTSRTLSALGTVATMTAKPYVPSNGVTYPTSALGKSLRDVARLVKAKVGLQVACVEMDDWDMHEGLGTVGAGRMHDQLTSLAAALHAFVTDLGSLMTGVTIVTMSEFGRRVEENGSSGVDHGHGNAMLLIGGGVNGGKVYGSWPTLADDALDNGDLPARTDYRAVLAEVLADRCHAPALATVFPAFTPRPLGVTATR